MKLGGAAVSGPLAFFEHVFVVNLNSRPDRRREMESELKAVGACASNITWFEAVQPADRGPFESVGARGCFLNHLAVLTEAANRKLTSVLVLEDDVDFVRDFASRMAIVEDDLKNRPWDVFYGGGRVNERTQVSAQLAKVECHNSITCAHFVALRGDTIRRVRDYVEAQLSRPQGDPDGGPMHVDGSYSWARRELSLETYVANPDLCHQRSSRSDIASKRWWDRAYGIRALAGKARQMVRASRRLRERAVTNQSVNVVKLLAV